jgi:hypothetical protein
MDSAHDNAPRSAIAVTLGYALMIAVVVAAYPGNPATERAGRSWLR